MAHKALFENELLVHWKKLIEFTLSLIAEDKHIFK